MGPITSGQRHSANPISPTVNVMAWSRKSKNEDTGAAVEIFASGSGVLVEGSPTAVSEFVDHMLKVTRSGGGQSRHLVVDGAQIAANVYAYRQTHREYFEFSERALKLLAEHGSIPTEGGFFRSFVKSGREFAGNLDWKPINFSPEQALSLQTMAGQMALRAVIKDVVAAIVEVGDKVDKLAALVKAERLGAALADRGTLYPLVQRTRETGKLSLTDWSTIASLGPWIARDIESLRAYVMRQLADVEVGFGVRGRVEESKDLSDDLLRESLALLVVAEENYALWQELRLAHAAHHERSALAYVTDDIRQRLAALTELDQRLVNKLGLVTEQLAAPTGYEGFAPLQKRRLQESAGQLQEIARWFSEQRHLDCPGAAMHEYPDIAQSLAKAGETISTAARTAIARTDEFLQRLTTDDEPEGPKQIES